MIILNILQSHILLLSLIYKFVPLITLYSGCTIELLYISFISNQNRFVKYVQKLHLKYSQFNVKKIVSFTYA